MRTPLDSTHYMFSGVQRRHICGWAAINSCNFMHWSRTQRNPCHCVYLVEYIPMTMTALFTVSHGSAYTVVRATQQVNGKWHFWGVRILYPLNRLTKNLTQVITSVRWPRMPNFIKNRRHKDWPAIWWNVHLAYIFFIIFVQEIPGEALPKKCSTISSA